MGFSETKTTERSLPMNPAVAQNAGSNEITNNGSTQQALNGLCNNGKRRLVFNIKNLGLAFSVILIITIIIAGSIALSRRSCEVLPTALHSPSTPTEYCPDHWIGYQRKCYYFSESEGNWTYSQNYCASLNASLVVIDSQEEMSFLRRYKGPADHWIGLQRMDNQEPWKWINDTIFNNWFKIRGGGTYAYLNHQGVASATSASEEPWICSKPVGKCETAQDSNSGRSYSMRNAEPCSLHNRGERLGNPP
ncbi:C-type lectin domain family 2 member D-like [Podarcis muralis]